MEGAKAIIKAAEQLNSPVILQTTGGGLKYGGEEELAAIGIACAKKASVKVALHLDHCQEVDQIKRMIDLGYTSVMMDGSHSPFDENVKLSLEAKEIIDNRDIGLETELGVVGGKEDDLEADGPVYTTVEEASKFYDLVKPDYLAIAVGTAHGIYSGEAKINFDRIKDIKEVTGAKLVLHGSSGVPNELISKSIHAGINKVNFDTELKQQLMRGIMEYMKDNPDAYDVRKIFQPGIDYQVEIIKERIKACRADNKN
ncbi:MAG: ketose-bisphosphate aldolase [Mycoplasmatales bacterium]